MLGVPVRRGVDEAEQTRLSGRIAPIAHGAGSRPTMTLEAMTLMREALKPATRVRYQAAWSRFVAWHADHPGPFRDPESAAADPITMANFLAAERGRAGLSRDSLSKLATGIRAALRERRLPSVSAQDSTVRAVLRGAGRLTASTESRSSPPVTVEVVDAICRAARDGRLGDLGLVTKTLVSISYYGSLRGGEAAALRGGDVLIGDGVVALMLVDTKTAAQATDKHQRLFAPLPAEHPRLATCPYRAILEYTLHFPPRARDEAFLRTPSGDPLADSTGANRILQAALLRTGHAGRGYSMHGLRHGATTALVEAGYTPDAIAAMNRHTSLTSQVAYRHPTVGMAHSMVRALAAGSARPLLRPLSSLGAGTEAR